MVKRCFDIFVSAVTSILVFPLLLFIAIAIKADSKGPVIFKQKRVGKDNRHFMIYKFRTMRTDTPDLPTHLLGDPSQYVSRVGRFLRKTSLDELPQLLNIILGHMSLVGPRPALYNQTDLVELRTSLDIHRIRPGLTGWAQINGRDDISDEEKALFDKYYHEHMSFWFDLKIMFQTFRNVVNAKGVRA